MNETLWLSGIIISLSAFAIKTGMSLSSLLFDGMTELKKKTKYSLMILLSYFVLFTLVYFIISQFNLLNYFGVTLKALEYGIIAHVIMAAGIFLWGMGILKGHNHKLFNTGSGALFLAVPCPVCFIVITLTLSVSSQIFTYSTLNTTLLLFTAFVAMTAITILALVPFKKKVRKHASSFMGTVMIIFSLYFILTVLIAPVFGEAKDVFSVASGMNENTIIEIKPIIIMLLCCIPLVVLGVLQHKIKFSLVRNIISGGIYKYLTQENRPTNL